jgi:hypothetical protein
VTQRRFGSRQSSRSFLTSVNYITFQDGEVTLPKPNGDVEHVIVDQAILQGIEPCESG